MEDDSVSRALKEMRARLGGLHGRALAHVEADLRQQLLEGQIDQSRAEELALIIAAWLSRKAGH